MKYTYQSFQETIDEVARLNAEAERTYGEGLTRESDSFLEEASRIAGDFQSSTDQIELQRHWTHMIGHICCLESWVYAKQLGLIDEGRLPIVLAPPKYCANHALLEYFLELGLFVQANTYDDRFNIFRYPLPYIRFRDGTFKVFNEFRRDLVEGHRNNGGGPLFKLSAKHLELGTKYLGSKGMKEGDWFVALHVRHTTHADGATRSAKTDMYGAAIEYLTGLGGWVVRLGDSGMPPLETNNPRVIDYATSTDKTPDLDIFLCGACRFFLGTESGLCNVPPLFGVRCLLTNWASFGVSSPFRDDLYIIRHYRQEDGRLVGLRDRASEPISHCQKNEILERLKLQEVSNSSEEILAATQDMFTIKETPDSEKARAYLREIGVVGSASLAPSFLQLNPDYLLELGGTPSNSSPKPKQNFLTKFLFSH